MNRVLTVQVGLDEGADKLKFLAAFAAFLKRRKEGTLGMVDEVFVPPAPEDGVLRCPKCGNADPKFFVAAVGTEAFYKSVETAEGRVVLRQRAPTVASPRVLVEFHCTAPLDLGLQTRHKQCDTTFARPEGVDVHVGL